MGDIIRPATRDPSHNGRGKNLPLPVSRRTKAGRRPRKISNGQDRDEPFEQGSRARTFVQNSEPSGTKNPGHVPTRSLNLVKEVSEDPEDRERKSLELTSRPTIQA